MIDDAPPPLLTHEQLEALLLDTTLDSSLWELLWDRYIEQEWEYQRQRQMNMYNDRDSWEASMRIRFEYLRDTASTKED